MCFWHVHVTTCMCEEKQETNKWHKQNHLEHSAFPAWRYCADVLTVVKSDYKKLQATCITDMLPVKSFWKSNSLEDEIPLSPCHVPFSIAITEHRSDSKLFIFVAHVMLWINKYGRSVRLQHVWAHHLTHMKKHQDNHQWIQTILFVSAFSDFSQQLPIH